MKYYISYTQWLFLRAISISMCFGFVCNLYSNKNFSCRTTCLNSYAPKVIYVNKNLFFRGDGLSWNTAYKNLNDALNRAATETGTVQMWVASATYYTDDGVGGSSDRTLSYYLLGNVEIYGGFIGNESSLSDRDWTTNPTILSGHINHPVSKVNTDNSYHVIANLSNTVDSTAILDGFTITGGYADGSGSDNDGGGMLNSDAWPTIRNCIFTDNYAEEGGAVYNSNSRATFENVTFDNNSAINGGALSARNGTNTIKIINCTFSNNMATASSGGAIYCPSGGVIIDIYKSEFSNNEANSSGGAIFLTGKTNINRSTFTANESGSKGGAITITASDSISILTLSIFSDNIANSGGGALRIQSNDPIISSCKFINNTSNFDNGGALQLSGASPQIINSIFCSNTANSFGTDGDAISNEFTSSPHIINCTFNNNGTSRGAIANFTGCTPTIRNCILWGNVNEITGTGVPASVDHCIIEGGYAMGTNILNVDPLFASELNCELFLQSNSLAINGGHNPYNSESEDIAGNNRVLNITIDIGAYEYCDGSMKSILYVDKTASGDNNGGTWTDAYNNLQDALDECSRGDRCTEVWVAQNTYYPDEGDTITDGNREAAFTMYTQTEIYGGFDGTETLRSQRDRINNPTILSGDIDQNDSSGDTTSNAYHVIHNEYPMNAPLDTTALIDGFSIIAAYADGSFPYNSGGGIYNSRSSAKFKNCTITDNYTSGQGGGLFNYANHPILDSCIIMNNKSNLFGGGIYSAIDSITIRGCTIRNNYASNFGGGIHVTNSHCNLKNSTIDSNTSGSSGGGIYSSLSNLTIEGTILHANNGFQGGGIFSTEGSLSVLDCRITENTASGDGGGIYTRLNTPQIHYCTINYNHSSENGAGIFISFSTNAVVSNCEIASNEADKYGGGVANSSNSTFTNCTIYGNSAGFAGGGVHNSASPSFYNCILWNDGLEIFNFTPPNAAMADRCIIEDGYSAGSNIVDIYPEFVDTSVNLDLDIQSCSPAIDAGLNSYNSSSVDIDGQPRLHDATSNGSALIDLGSYEYQSNFADCSDCIENLQLSGNIASGTYTASSSITCSGT